MLITCWLTTLALEVKMPGRPVKAPPDESVSLVLVAAGDCILKPTLRPEPDETLGVVVCSEAARPWCMRANAIAASDESSDKSSA